MITTIDLSNAAAALGVGMLVGLERERRKGQGPRRGSAGLRTFAITALLGFTSLRVGGTLLLATLAMAVAVLLTVAYWRSEEDDPGLTSEVALLAVLVLGALCDTAPQLALAVAVVMTGLLAYRQTLHHFVRSQLSDREIADGLTLLVAALVILPLAPDRFIGPYAAFNLRTIGTLTVLLMAVGALGHIAMRTLGAHYGYALSAVASGFVSSTVTIASMGQRVANAPGQVKTLAAAAILSNLGTVTQIGLILTTVESGLLRAMWLPLSLGVACTVLYAACLMFPRSDPGRTEPVTDKGAFNPKLALIVALSMTVITFVSSVTLNYFGQLGVMLTALVGGFADAHASTASIASLVKSGQLNSTAIASLVMLAVSSNSLSKCVLAAISGGRRFALWVIPGQVLLTLAMWAGAWLQ
ncbi:MgtC/SapB family protein [Pseudomonas sp. NFXW11]|uniref:MgtC/SapB family protein n=1 Tax=Pseudomonas sp. NFXW11 TaxID=2819531 RepID=UPI003CEE65C9